MEKRTKRLIIGLGAFVAVALAATLLFVSLFPGTSLSPVQNFTLPDSDGKAVSLSDYAGRPVVVAFWASWCSDCQEQMPLWQQAQNKYGDNVAFLLVNCTANPKETPQAANSYLAQNQYSFPTILWDEEGRVSELYEIYFIPTTLFVNAEGQITARYNDIMDETQLEKELTRLMT